MRRAAEIVESPSTSPAAEGRRRRVRLMALVLIPAYALAISNEIRALNPPPPVLALELLNIGTAPVEVSALSVDGRTLEPTTTPLAPREAAGAAPGSWRYQAPTLPQSERATVRLRLRDPATGTERGAEFRLPKPGQRRCEVTVLLRDDRLDVIGCEDPSKTPLWA